MTPDKILNLLWGHGFHVSLTDGDGLKVSPSSTLHPNLRELLRANKSEIVALLIEAHKTNDWLIEAAMRACDHHGDSQAARQQMRDECMALPADAQPDLLNHFKKTYAISNLSKEKS